MATRPRKPAAIDEGDGGALLQAVYERPDEDGPRLVYADWLQERGDPRGELIVLQCSKSIDAAQEQRVRELLEAHARGWIGPLAEVITAVEFRRGFPADVVIGPAPVTKLGKSLGAPAWATVERIEFQGTVGGVVRTISGETARERVVRGVRVPAARLLLDPSLRGLREVRGIDGDVLLTLCGSPRPLPIEVLSAGLSERRHHSSATSAAIGRCPGLPRLRRLHLDGGTDLRALLAGPLEARLEQLELQNWAGTLGEQIAACAASTRMPELVLQRARKGDILQRWVHQLRRGDDGRLSRLEAAIDLVSDQAWGRSVDELATSLQTIAPPALTALRVTFAHGQLSDDERRRIEVAAQRFTGLGAPPDFARVD